MISENVPDLSVHKFDDQVYSVEVEGWCQWTIFSGENNDKVPVTIRLLMSLIYFGH